MVQIPPAGPGEGLEIAPARELRDAPRAVVQFGTAPDGLPWLLHVDRSARLQLLVTTILSVFELAEWERLPARIRTVVEKDVARGLFGVHELDLPTGRAEAFVSRRPARELFGRTIVSEILDRRGRTAPASSPSAAPITAVSARADDGGVELAERLAKTIEDRLAVRHLLLALDDGSAWAGNVREEDRPLRVPTGPYRPAVFESLGAFPGAQAIVTAAGVTDPWRIPAADRLKYQEILLRAAQSGYGGHVSFEIPRREILEVLVAVARLAGELHEDGRVHGDLTPANILLDGRSPVSFDSLNLKTGEVATAATFEWAPPEQIVGRPVDPRADVYTLARAACVLLGGIPYGEETVYVVPVGGSDARRVKILKTDGVFIDTRVGGQNREWQKAWQGFLAGALAHDVDRRPADGVALADTLADLAATHAPGGVVRLEGPYGRPVPIHGHGARAFGRLIED